MMTSLYLKAVVKAKLDSCKRFASHDFLLAVFIFKNPRTENEGDIIGKIPE